MQEDDNNNKLNKELDDEDSSTESMLQWELWNNKVQNETAKTIQELDNYLACNLYVIVALFDNLILF